MSKAFLKLSVIMLAMAMTFVSVPFAQAGTSDTMVVKVTISASISVNVTEAEYLFGTVSAGSTTASTSAVTVTNDGSGINETYSLSLTNPSGWTASQSSAGTEIYVLNAAFDADGSSISWSTTNHALSTTAAVCTSTKFAADQTGVSVPYNSARKLWFQFKAPTATIISTQQGITVTVTAQAA